MGTKGTTAAEQTYSEADLLDAVDDLLKIENDSGLWDEPGEYWDEGDGYIASNDPSASAELKAVLQRLRAIRDAANRARTMARQKGV